MFEKMLVMRLFFCFLQFLVGLVLFVVFFQQWVLFVGNGLLEVEVVFFQEVWGCSYCWVLERLVDVVFEYFSEVEYMFSLFCVFLLCCIGCCGDENLYCVLVEMVNVIMQFLKICFGDWFFYVELMFFQYVCCECWFLWEKMKLERCGDVVFWR